MKKQTGKTKYIAAVLAASMILGAVSPVVSFASENTTPQTGTSPSNQSTGSATISTNKSSGAQASGSEKKERWAAESMRKYGITYKQFVEKYGEPKDAHLFVGTYLIDIAPTDEMIKNGEEAVSGATYIGAVKSKLTYGQDITFYKSELASGEWRDIAFANDLSSIRVGSGTPVDDAEIDEMLITKYVKGGQETEPWNDDGDGDDDASRKNPFLEPSPYNLDEMPEMATLLGMTSDGTLSYDPKNSEYDEVAKNQSNYFLSTRLKYMFAHDEVTGTIKIHPGDGERAKILNKRLTSGKGSSVNMRVEKQFDETEDKGGLFLDPLRDLPNDMIRAEYSIGDDGNIASSSRILYHFSDTRDDLTDVMDEGVVNVWELYLLYRDAAKEAGEEDDSFDPQEGVIYNKDKYAFLYEICSDADSTRRGQAYYNLSANDDFHGGTGSVLNNMISMNDYGTSDIGRNIDNASFYTPVTEKPALTRLLDGVSYGFQQVASVVPGIDVKEPVKPDPNYGGFKSNDTLKTELASAREESINTYTDYSEFMMSRGSTALSQLIYDDKTELFKKTKKDDATDSLIVEAMLACAIRDDTVKLADEEIELLKVKLIKPQNTMLSNEVAADLPDTYNVPETTGADAENARKSALLLTQKNTGMATESAMEKLIEAYLKRETVKENYGRLLTGQLTWIRVQKNKIKDTDYKVYAEEIRNKYEQYLINKMRELGIEVPDDDSEGDPIDWDGAKKKAIEDNDPAGLAEIEKLQDKYKGKSDSTPPGFTPVLKKDPTTGRFQIVYEKKDNGSGTGDNSGTGGDSGSGTGGTGDTNISQGGGLSGSSDLPVPNGSMLDNLENFLGKKFDDMDPDSQAELVAALNQFGRENNNDEALELARDLLERIMANKNPFVYAQYVSNNQTEYVSLACIDRARQYTNLRLVIEDTYITTSALDTGVSYVYQLGSPTVKNVDGKSEEMTTRLVSQEDVYLNRGDVRHPYLGEEDTQIRLGCRAEYIVDTYYSILVTSAMEPNIKKIVAQLVDWYKY